MAGIKFTNFASTTIATASVSPLATSFSVAAATGNLFPTIGAGEWFYLVLVDSLTAPTKREVVKVTTRTVDSMAVIERAQEGTTAQTWVAGNFCACRLTAQGLADRLADGVFTTLSVSGLVSGAGFAARFSSPGPIGNVTEATGQFTILRASVSINYAGGDNASSTNSGYGDESLDSNSGGLYNAAFGYKSLTANTNGSGNSAFGAEALKLATSNNNTAVGYKASAATVTGVRNTALGYQALLLDTGTGYNTALGYSVLSANTTGEANVGVGSQALVANTTGLLNVAVGQTSLFNNVDGSENVAIGNTALGNNISGGKNVAIGASSALNYQGSGITAIGYEALVLATGDNNTAVGYQSLAAVTSGDDNTAVGHNAADTLTTGNKNTIVGSTADTIAAAENSTAIGYGAICTASNQVVIGDANVTATTLRGAVKTNNYFGSDSDTVLSAPAATGVRVASNATVGAILTGYGTTSDVWIANRNGTKVFSIDTNGAQMVGGTLKVQAGTGTGRPRVGGVLSVDTTQVGNVGAGTDDLMTYSLIANSLSSDGKGVRVTAWGTAANNGNAKTLTINFGGVTVATYSIGLSNNKAWRADLEVYRTSASVQICFARIQQASSSPLFVQEVVTSTETDTSTIIIKCTGAATSDNDIVQNGMLVEFIS